MSIYICQDETCQFMWQSCLFLHSCCPKCGMVWEEDQDKELLEVA